MLNKSLIAASVGFACLGAGNGIASVQVEGDEVFRGVVQNAQGAPLEVSGKVQALIDAVGAEARARGRSGAAAVSESTRHDPAAGSMTAPEGTVFCGKVLKPVAAADEQNGRRNVAVLQFTVEAEDARVSWTSSPREGADPARLKHREFELVFVPADLFPALVEAGQCWG